MPDGTAPTPRGGRAQSLFRWLRPGLPPIGKAADARLAIQGALSTAGVVVQGAVRFVFSVAVGNAFGKVLLGAANSAISLALLASLLQPSAAASAATKFVARARGSSDASLASDVTAYLLRRTIVAALVLGVCGSALAPWLLDLSPLESLLTGLLVIAYSGYMFLRGVLFGSGLVVRATVWDVVSSGVALTALALVVLARVEAWVLLPLVLGYAAYVAANLPRRARGTVPPELVREMNSFLRVTLVNSVAAGGFLQLSMVAARYWDPSGAGAFAAALALATPASLVSRSLSLVLFPSMSSAYGRGDHAAVRRQTDVSTRVLVVVSLATYGPLMILSPSLISLFFRRAEFGEGAQLLPILLAAVMVLNVVIGATNTLLTREHRHAQVVMRASLIGAVAGIVVWAVSVPWRGVLAVAVGYLMGSVVMAALPVATAWRLESMSWTPLWGRFVVASILAGVLSWWTLESRASAVAQVLCAFTFLLAWLAASWRDSRLTLDLLRHPSAKR